MNLSPPTERRLNLPATSELAYPEMSRIAVEFSKIRPYNGARLIMADPPWNFGLWSENGAGRSPTAHYDCQGLDWIKALPVDVLAGKNCLLWLWATNPMLPQALEVIEAWGFTFKTAGTWVKRTVHGANCFGGGYIFRSANEPILIATRGRVKVAERSIRSILSDFGGGAAEMLHEQDPLRSLGFTIEARRREHSRKPDLAYATARRLVPTGTGIDLFSREHRPGWTSWGNEAGKFNLEIDK